MNNKSKIVYAGAVLALTLSLGACDPAAKTETEVSTKEDSTTSLKENTATEILEEDSATASTEMVTEGNTKRPKYLPADFPLPDDVEIETSHSRQTEGKKSVLLIIRTKEDMATITSMYTTYFEQRQLENAAETIDDKNIIIQGESPSNSEYWSMIGGILASMDGVIELTITWEEL